MKRGGSFILGRIVYKRSWWTEKVCCEAGSEVGEERRLNSSASCVNCSWGMNKINCFLFLFGLFR